MSQLIFDIILIIVSVLIFGTEIIDGSIVCALVAGLSALLSSASFYFDYNNFKKNTSRRNK